MKNDDEKFEHELENSFIQLDNIEIPTPDFKFFKDMVDKQQAAARRAQKRQLGLFIAVAAVLMSAIIFFIGQSEMLFVAMQGAAVLAAVACLSVFYARKPKEGFR